jgi:hypothetical protein
VEIDVATKVKFMTGKDFKAYRNGKTHTYVGGLYEESPVRFVVPHDAVWNVVVEKGTYNAPIEVQASCRVMAPNNTVHTSIASDDPHALADARNTALANEMNLAGRSEG